MRIEKNLPGGDPEPLEQLEFPIELNPDEEGLTEAWLFLLGLVGETIWRDFLKLTKQQLNTFYLPYSFNQNLYKFILKYLKKEQNKVYK